MPQPHFSTPRGVYLDPILALQDMMNSVMQKMIIEITKRFKLFRTKGGKQQF